MAPLSSEPRQMVVVLNLARRKALYHTVVEITGYMRSQLELHADDATEESSLGSPSSSRVSSPVDRNSAAPFAAPHNPAEPEVDVSISQKHTPPSQQLIALRRAALAHFDEWRKEFLAKLKEVVSVADDNKVLEERRKRQEKMARLKTEVPADGENLIDFGGDGVADDKTQQSDTAKAVQALQAVSYHPIPTRLTSIPAEDRKEVLSAVLILLLSTGNYSAYSRAFIIYLTSAFELPLSVLTSEEKEIAKTMIEASAEAEKANKDGMSAEAEAQKRKQQNQSSRYWKVGLASVAGAAVIGITGGLAAPVVAGAIGGLMGSVGLGGLASFLGIFWMNGALVGTLFGAFGARMTGEMVDKYAKEVEDFKFLPLKDEWGPEFRQEDKDIRRLRVTIGINGWLTSRDEVTKPWRVLGDDTEVFALRYEVESLLKLGSALQDMVKSYAWSALKYEILRRTVMATLWAALWPIQLLSLASGIDNPFNLAKNRSEKAGRILADALINKVQGERPVTLVGYSLGARVIYFCLKTLAERKAFGLVDTVVFIGAPAPSNRNHWQMMRSVVAGKMFNVYSEHDYILAFLYRTTSIQLGIAGLQAVKDIEGVEDLDLSEEVKGHLRYPDLIAKILTRCGFPNVRGGEGPIEKETEEDIALRDSDTSSKEGMLVDLGGSSPPPVTVRPLRKPHRDISFPSGIHSAEMRPVVKKVQSEPVSKKLDPLGARSAITADQESKSLADPVVKESPQRIGLPSPSEFGTASQPPPPYSPGLFGPRRPGSPTNPMKHSQPTKDDSEDDEESRDFGGGISMVDNADDDDDDDDDEDDDMTTYMEPLRLEDRDDK